MKWKVWKTIRSDVSFTGVRDFRQRAEKAKVEFRHNVNDVMLGDVKWRAKDAVDLVLVSPLDLGFRREVYRDVVLLDPLINSAKRQGLIMCETSDGPRLRIQYKNQPRGERVRVISYMMAYCAGYMDIFALERDNSGLVLDTGYMTLWPIEEDMKLVFRLPRESRQVA